MPAGIKHVDISAFGRCKNLSTIYSDIADITSVEFEKSYDGTVTAFDGIDKDCLWNVLKGTEESYITQSWWVDTWKTAIHTGISEIAINTFRTEWQNGTLSISTDTNSTIRIYAINGTLIQSINAKSGETYQVELPRGMYIINNKKVVLK